MPRQAAAPRRRAAAAPRRAPVRRAPIRKAASYAAPIRQPKPRSAAGSAFRSAGATGGSVLGTAFGGPAGGAIGGMLGRGAGALLSKIFGHGDYQVSNVQGVKENSLVVANAANIPEFGTGRVAVKFRHREFLGDVIASATPGAFKIDSYAINPGLPSSFPWLANVVGASFQQHRINGLTYEFRSMSADALNSTNTALGSVIMATDYDSPDSVFTTKQQMENTEYGVSCKPSVNMMHAIECARGQTPVSELYIRAYINPPNTDLRLYDLGRFSIATVGCQAASVNLGELWCTYDIDAFKAIEQPPGYQQPMVHYNLAGTVSATPLLVDTTVNAVQPYFDSIGIASKTNLSITLPLTTNNQSLWMVMLCFRGASTAGLVAPSYTLSGGLVSGWPSGPNAAGFINGNSGGYNAPQTATGTTVMICNIFYYNGTGTLAVPPTITFGAAGVLPGTSQGGDLVIVQVNGTAK